ncbi:hypothetical protein LSAT2_029474 [Lamellibrachia satsuma]|nr:hypothetical protein LSAT2_029474 [Lamellibrachia satsuma]
MIGSIVNNGSTTRAIIATIVTRPLRNAILLSAKTNLNTSTAGACVYILACTYWRVRTGVYRLACTYWRVQTGVYILACTDWRVRTGVYRLEDMIKEDYERKERARVQMKKSFPAGKRTVFRRGKLMIEGVVVPNQLGERHLCLRKTL